jgi:hypothetical protein
MKTLYNLTGLKSKWANIYIASELALIIFTLAALILYLL